MLKHREMHRTDRIGWLRAAVLGANDGIISTASLITGVAAAHASHHSILITGIAGLVAGSMAMATGEYVSVSSQEDTERADIERERQELASDPAGEHNELVSIYMARGLDRELAEKVATQLTQHDALGTHIREELGIFETLNAQPVQAALASAATFAVGASLPLIVVLLAPTSTLVWVESLTSLIFLALLGAVAAYVGGANVIKSALRVAFWGALAMALTASVGALFGVRPE